MAWIIGPDGRLIDDGSNGFEHQPNKLTADQMTPEMIDAVLGYKTTGELHTRAPAVDIGQAQIEAEPTYTGVFAELYKRGMEEQLANRPVVDPYSDTKATSNKQLAKNDAERLKKVGYKESGPNGVLPGDADPYNLQFGSGSEDLMQARAGQLESSQMAEGALDIQEVAGEQEADIAKRQLADEELAHTFAQDVENKKAGMVADARVKRQQAAEEARVNTIKRVEDWNKEAEEAANTEVDNNRYWNNRSAFSKISYMIGALAGGFAGEGSGNVALGMLQTEIGRDIAGQNDRISRKMKFLQDKRGNIDLLNNLDRLKVEDLDQDMLAGIKEFDIRLSSANKEIDKIVARYGQEKVAPQLLKLKADILTGQANIRGAFYNTLYNDANAKIDREFQAAESARTRNHQAWMAKRSHEWDLENIEAEKKAKIDEMQNTGQIDTELMGGFTIGANGGEIGMMKLNPNLPDGAYEHFIEKAQGLKDEFEALKALEESMSGASWDEMVRNSNGQSAALAAAISTRYATSGKAVSDKELDIQIQKLVGGKGSLDAALRSGSIKNVLKKNVDENLKRGESVLRAYADPSMGKVVYKPQWNYQSQGEADTGADGDSLATEWEGKAGVKSTAKGKPQDIKRNDEFADYATGSAAIKKAVADGNSKELVRMFGALTNIHNNPKQTDKGYETDDTIRVLMEEAGEAIVNMHSKEERKKNGPAIEEYYQGDTATEYPSDY